MKRWLPIFILVAGLWSQGGSCIHAAETEARQWRVQNFQNTRGTYCRAPHLENGRVDVQRLVTELVDIHANTYSFCIHTAPTDWDDLQLFLPLAREHGIRVWASIVPPSESPPHNKLFAEPFKMDYDRWAVEFAKLGLRETNLVAWSIDDFSHNLKWFTPERLAKMLSNAREINPRLAFVPCCYFKAITPEFVKNYAPIIDGILFPYRHDSAVANLTDASLTAPEVKQLKEVTGGTLPIVIDVYATAHSRLGKSTAAYVEQVMVAGKSSADGVMIYCHQNPKQDAEKYQIIKRLFTSWSGRVPKTPGN